MLLIVDFDGTVADSYGLVYTVLWRHARGALPARDAVRRLPSREVVRRMRLGPLGLPLVAREVRREFTRKLPVLQPIAGMSEALRGLVAGGHRLVLLSANTPGNTRAFLQQHRLAPLFARRISVRTIFGKHRALRRIVRAERVAPAAAVYVGDETRDVVAARKAGLLSVAVSWGYNARETLLQFRPDLMCDAPAQLGAL